jgi:hypothetical protein
MSGGDVSIAHIGMPALQLYSFFPKSIGMPGDKLPQIHGTPYISAALRRKTHEICPYFAFRRLRLMQYFDSNSKDRYSFGFIESTALIGGWEHARL